MFANPKYGEICVCAPECLSACRHVYCCCVYTVYCLCFVFRFYLCSTLQLLESDGLVCVKDAESDKNMDESLLGRIKKILYLKE